MNISIQPSASSRNAPHTHKFGCISIQSTKKMLETSEGFLLFNGSLFSSKTDEEILSSIAQDGAADFCRKNPGSYNFFFFDKKENKGVFACDTFSDRHFFWSSQNGMIFVAEKLSDFANEIDRHWVNRYFEGNDSTTQGTALKDVFRIQAGEILSVDRNLNHSVASYQDLNSLFETWFSASGGRSTEEVTLKTEEILIKTLQSLSARYGTLGLKMSQGMDSLHLLALLKKSEVPFKTFTRMYSSDKNSSLWKMHREIMEIYPHENYIDEIDGTVRFNSEDYSQPDCHLWHSLSITRNTTVVSAAQKGVKCLLSGYMGDYLFFHRTRYLAALFLSQSKDSQEFKEASEAILDSGWRLLSPEKIDRLKQKILEMMQNYKSDLSGSYSENSKEINRFFLRDFFVTSSASFASYVFNSIHSLKGLSHERDLSLASGITVLDPMKDSRLFQIVFSLRQSDLLNSIVHSSIQKKTIESAFPTMPVAKKSTNFTPSDRPFSLDQGYSLSLLKGLNVLDDLNVESVSYYKGLYEGFSKNGTLVKDLSRVLTFSYFYDNWVN